MLTLLLKFARARTGLAAIEFALIVPVVSVLTLGLIEITSALECRQRVTAMASTAADLVAQYTQISNSEMDDVLSATTAVLYPFPSTGSQVVISSITSDGTGGGKVAWSKGSSGATARAANSGVTVPAGLMPAYSCTNGNCTGCAAGACSVILAEISYDYASYSNTTRFIARSLPLTDAFYAKPRRSTAVGFGP
jgi:Flp pilus assembly protein TadG